MASVFVWGAGSPGPLPLFPVPLSLPGPCPQFANWLCQDTCHTLGGGNLDLSDSCSGRLSFPRWWWRGGVGGRPAPTPVGLCRILFHTCSLSLSVFVLCQPFFSVPLFCVMIWRDSQTSPASYHFVPLRRLLALVRVL